MLSIEVFDKCNSFQDKSDGWINCYWSYDKSKSRNLDFLVFNDIIWDKNVRDIVETLKSLDIKEFIISSGYSGLLEVLNLFQEEGCTFGKIEKVKWYDNEYDINSNYIAGIKVLIN